MVLKKVETYGNGRIAVGVCINDFWDGRSTATVVLWKGFGVEWFRC